MTVRELMMQLTMQHPNHPVQMYVGGRVCDIKSVELWEGSPDEDDAPQVILSFD